VAAFTAEFDPQPFHLDEEAAEGPHRRSLGHLPLQARPDGRFSAFASVNTAVTSWEAALRIKVMRNSEPIGIRPILFRRSDASEIGCPFTLVMTSPALIPAFSAGESAMTSLTTAPISILSPKVVAKSGVNVPSDRPIGCWSSWAATARG
jgi:hypothetical protein